MLPAGEITAPAKINLTLEILDRRDDGYHRLRSVMVPIGLYDRIAWRPSERFSFETGDPALAEGNLVERAFAALGLGYAAVAVRLEKQIPVGGGLGGGSSDAAAIVRAAMRGAFGALEGIDWVARARELGSDVPFFLIDGPALVEGTGERITALGAAPPWWICLVVPPATVPTGDAYRRLDASRDGQRPRESRAESPSLRLGAALQRADFAATLASLHNDFEPVVAAAYPPIGEALEALRRAGVARPMLSGSGACVFALCEDEAEARRIAASPLPAGARALALPFAASEVWQPSR